MIKARTFSDAISSASRKGWAFCLSSIYFSLTASYRCFQMETVFSAEASCPVTAVQPFLLSLDFELGDGQVFFGAATLTALYIRVPGVAHIVEEIILQDTVGLLQRTGLPFFCGHGLSGIVQQGLGCPLLASADLHDGLLDGCRPVPCPCSVSTTGSAFPPQAHRPHEDGSGRPPGPCFGHGAVDLIGVHHSGEDILLTAHDLHGSFVGILIKLFGELIAAVIVKVGRVDIKDNSQYGMASGFRASRGDRASCSIWANSSVVAGGWLFEVDVPCSALGDDVVVADSCPFHAHCAAGCCQQPCPKRRDFGHWCGQCHHFLPRDPSFQGYRQVTGNEGTSSEV